jgi:hypothetical protein
VLPDRFWERVSPEPNTGCWLWTGAEFRGGYGRLGPRLAHRMAYEALVGPVPEGLDLDHLCRVRCCVNPDHLEPVTRRENILRGAGGRMIKECPLGHAYTEDNTRYTAEGWRYCKTCKRTRTLDYLKRRYYKGKNRG